jgi:DNA-binding transcriptional MerR regulator
MNMPMKPSTVLLDRYSAAKAARVAGLSLHMVDYLCRTEIVTPSTDTLRGRGRGRKYTYADIVLLKVVARLLNQGISVLKCKKGLTAMRRRYPNTPDLLSKKYFVTDGIEIFLQNADVLEKIESGQIAFAFVIDLCPIREQITAKLERRRAS